MSTAELAPGRVGEYFVPHLAGVCLRAARTWSTFAEKLKDPAFEGWTRSANGAPALCLIQLWPPADIEHTASKRAVKIARVLGGTWRKEGDKWEGKLADEMDGLTVILHRVEPPPSPAPDGPLIDLTRYTEGEE